MRSVFKSAILGLAVAAAGATTAVSDDSTTPDTGTPQTATGSVTLSAVSDGGIVRTWVDGYQGRRAERVEKTSRPLGKSHARP